MAAATTPRTDRADQALAEPLAEIEGMILRLTELRQHEASKERRADYQAAIDRLIALAYRLTEASKSRAIGLQKPAAPVPPAPAPAAKPPQATLPLGPVIVRARKPKPR